MANIYGRAGAPPLKRFWRFVKITPNLCWEWTGALRTTGYGSFYDGERVVKAHRFSYAFYNDPIPKDACVLHTCHNRKCVNPAHLKLGDRAQNQRDMVEAGRSLRGERHNLVKLTEADVLAIRASTKTGVELARQYGVGKMQISRIRRRERWRATS